MADRAVRRDSRPGPTARRGRSADSHWAGQYWVTVLLVVAFLALAGALIWKDNASTSAWQRLDSVFGVVGAITLTAVGWLFGREVHRGEAQAAKRDANQSKDRLDVATNRLTARTGDAIRLHTKLTTLATAVIEAPPAPGSQDRRPLAPRTTTARSAGHERSGPEGAGLGSVGLGITTRAVSDGEPTSPPEDGLAMLRALAAALITDEPPPNRGGGGPRGGGNARQGGGNARQSGGNARRAGGNRERAPGDQGRAPGDQGRAPEDQGGGAPEARTP